jgi:hypothetical protein
MARIWISSESRKEMRQRMHVAEERAKENQRRTASGYPQKRRRRPLPFEFDELLGKPASAASKPIQAK